MTRNHNPNPNKYIANTSEHLMHEEKADHLGFKPSLATGLGVDCVAAAHACVGVADHPLDPLAL